MDRIVTGFLQMVSLSDVRVRFQVFIPNFRLHVSGTVRMKKQNKTEIRN